VVVAALAAYALAAGAGTGAAANGHRLWRDNNGHGPWITDVCSLPVPHVGRCAADVVTNSAGRPQAGATPSPGSLGPSQFHSAYNLPTSAPNAQTIGIVDAFDDPNIAGDLAHYDSFYGIPAPPSFRKVNQTGGTAYPRSNSGWDLEIALDVETAHAVCQNCNILLVEANSASLADLGAAENEAVKLGATVISNSWGSSEYSTETADEAAYFNHPGVAITASAGDSGFGAMFPAASHYVTAVGGTTLTLNSNGNWAGETVWSGTGSGCSQYEPKPSWQHDGCSHRTLNDVAADADPKSGAAVYDSVPYQLQSGWFQVGGTSLASPLIAAVYALAGNPASVNAGSSPYSASSSQLHDISSGSDGSCGGSYLCTAAVGYDGPTGMGTPNGVGAFAGTPAPPPTAPGAPVNLMATPGDQFVSLSWTAPFNNGGSNITSYNIYRGTASGGETLVKTGVAGTSYTDTGLADGTTYYYEVTAVNGVGEGGLSNEASALPAASVPGAPTGLHATGGNSLVSLSWTAPAGPVSSYDVYRGTTPGGESSTPIATGVPGTGYTDNTALNGTTYYYKVSAVNGTGEGAKSGEASATPQAPQSGNFSLSISPSSPRFLGPTASTTYTVTITPTNGFSGPVSLSVSGLPSHVTGSFSVNPATTSSTLIVTSSSAPFASATLTVTGTSGSLTHTASVSLTVF